MNLQDENLEILTQRCGSRLLIPIDDACEAIGITRKVAENDESFPRIKVSGRWYTNKLKLAKWLGR